MSASEMIDKLLLFVKEWNSVLKRCYQGGLHFALHMSKQSSLDVQFGSDKENRKSSEKIV